MKKQSSISSLEIYIPYKMKEEIDTALLGLTVEEYQIAYDAEQNADPGDYENLVSLQLMNRIIPTLKTGDTEGHLLFENKTFEGCFSLHREISQHWRPSIKERMTKAGITIPTNKKSNDEERKEELEETLAIREAAVNRREIEILVNERELAIVAAKVETRRQQIKTEELKVKKVLATITEETMTLEEKKQKLENREKKIHRHTQENQDKRNMLNQHRKRLLQSFPAKIEHLQKTTSFQPLYSIGSNLFKEKVSKEKETQLNHHQNSLNKNFSMNGE